MSYKFLSGTTTKGQIYDTIIALMQSAGWVNISSKSDTDFAVMKSTSESGDKNLIFQFRPHGTSATYHTVTSGYSTLSYRLIGNYTPGSVGVAGTSTRSAEAWKNLMIAPVAATTATNDPSTPVTYYYHVNKNRLILVIEYPPAANFNPVVLYIGIPDETYCSEPNSRGLLVMSSAQATIEVGVAITDAAGENASLPAPTTRTLYVTLPPKSPNSAGLYTLAEMFYGDTTEGIRGKITGLFAINNDTGISNGDIVQIGVRNFRCVVPGTSGVSSFPSDCLFFEV